MARSPAEPRAKDQSPVEPELDPIAGEFEQVFFDPREAAIEVIHASKIRGSAAGLKPA